ncbi:DUF2690 domain-containing protein [Streptomyces sp. NPDC001744]|uniref:helix-turn-helix domain-containing protein n=1 Tax=Streptomyces sp. NPDC001744 TaxID=3364606 RepID=UPI00367688F2
MPGWKALPDGLDPETRALTERMRRLIDRSGLGVMAVAERTGRERSQWDAYLSARRPVPRTAVAALAEVTGADAGELAAQWERAERARGRSASAPGPDGGVPDGGGRLGEGPDVGHPAPGGRLGEGPDVGHPAPGGKSGENPAGESPGAARRFDGPPGAVRPVAGAPVVGEPWGAAGSGGHDDRTLRIRHLGGPVPQEPSGPAPGRVPPPPSGPVASPPTGAASPPPPPPGEAAPPSAPAPRRRAATVLLRAAGGLGALLVVAAALLLVDLGGGGTDGADGRAAAPSTTPPPSPTRRTDLPAGVECSGADCAGRDPEAMGCGGPLATTVARARVGTARVEVRHSAVCAASWARITGAAPGDSVTVEVGGAVRSAIVPEAADGATARTDAYTPMLPDAPGAAVRACGALADGSEGCAKGR